MGGRQHHYLPQLIQRPFAHRQQGKEFYVYAHHRQVGRFAPNTKGIGKELDFYGGPDDTSLDDAITRGESELASTVQAVNRGVEVAPADMATLICALAFRTKSMREALAGVFPALLAALRVRLLDVTRLRHDLIASLTDSKMSRRLIYEQIDKRMGPLPREQRAKVYGTLRPLWKRYVAEQEEQLVAEAWQLVSVVLAKARAEADTIANGAYLKALAKDPAMPVRASRMANEMVFEVLVAEPGEFFVLGDCGPVAVFSDGKPRLALGAFEPGVEAEMVFMPTSPRRCIYAHRSAVTTSMRSDEINRISASLSLEFFISDREASEELDMLRSLIGSLAPIDAEDDIIQALSYLDK